MNGDSFQLPAVISTVDQLLAHLDLTERIVIIEQNKLILDQDAYNSPIMDGDQIEIIHFVGGG